MGKPMAKNLINAGYGIIAYDIVEETLNEIVEYGGKYIVMLYKEARI